MASAEILSVAGQVTPARRITAALDAVSLIVPAYYDAAGSLAVAWYDELRDASRPTTTYAPEIIGDPSTDWIEREVADLRRSLDVDLETGMQRLLDEAAALAEKEVARGFRDTIVGNVRMDRDAIGWSRIARGGACKLCVMLADRGAVYRETTVHFATHGHCHCGAQPEFANGTHGPEASVAQYLASTKRRTPEQQAQLREYLNTNYPDAPG